MTKILEHALRCSCQIVNMVSAECVRLGKCKERGKRLMADPLIEPADEIERLREENERLREALAGRLRAALATERARADQ